jgi:hypothetical protein
MVQICDECGSVMCWKGRADFECRSCGRTDRRVPAATHPDSDLWDEPGPGDGPDGRPETDGEGQTSLGDWS